MLNFREVEWLPQSPTATSWLSWLAGGGGPWGGVHMCLTYELECLAAKPTPWLPLSVIVTKLFLMTFLSKSPLLEIVKDSTNYLLPLEIFLDSFFFFKQREAFATFVIRSSFWGQHRPSDCCRIVVTWKVLPQTSGFLELLQLCSILHLLFCVSYILLWRTVFNKVV